MVGSAIQAAKTAMSDSAKEWIADFIKNVGFPIALCVGFGWVAVGQIDAFGKRFDALLQFQREVEIQAIERGNQAIERGNQIQERSNTVIESLCKALDSRPDSRPTKQTRIP